MPYKSRQLANPVDLSDTTLFRFTPDRLAERIGEKMYVWTHVGHGSFRARGGEVQESNRDDCDYVLKRHTAPLEIPLTHGTSLYELRENPSLGKKGKNRLRYGVIIDESD
jgi:hypothetical protein